MKRKWSISSEEARKKCINEIIARVDEQQGSQFGILASEEVIAIVAKYLGPDSYNMGLKDATKVIQNHFSDIEIDLDLLKHEG